MIAVAVAVPAPGPPMLTSIDAVHVSDLQLPCHTGGKREALNPGFFPSACAASRCEQPNLPLTCGPELGVLLSTAMEAKDRSSMSQFSEPFSVNLLRDMGRFR
jgi:hypothetical protein